MASWFSGKLSPFMKGNRSYWRYTHVPLNHDVMGGRINRWLLERRWSKNPSNILKFTSKVGPKIPPQQSMKPTENDPNKNTNWYGNPRFLHFLVVTTHLLGVFLFPSFFHGVFGGPRVGNGQLVEPWNATRHFKPPKWMTTTMIDPSTKVEKLWDSLWALWKIL